MTTTSEPTTDHKALEPGAIWRTSWGYDQTNVEFFQVVRRTKASIVLRRIKAEVRDGRLYPRPDQWNTDWHLMGNDGTAASDRDKARGYSEKICRIRSGYRGDPVARIDDVRSAWPYYGDGAYDTKAAGQEGH